MATTIQATPVTPIPIIPTALARNLSGPLRLSEVQGTAKCGYLTMDHTRKLLLLLESDPKAFTLPLVGIWVSGVYSIHHPFIWACCLRYLFSSAIQQRVFASGSSFIVLLYTPVKSAPDVWECQPQQEKPNNKIFELYSCYDNLHLEIPPGPSSSEALCFELFPAPEGMGRSLFQQATDMWEKECELEKVNQNGGFLHPNQAVTIPSSPKEEPSPEPRPTPSPHPQNVQLILPEAEETSLSLSFEEPSSTECLQHGFANRQILRQTQSKIKQAKAQIPQRWRTNCDQENGQMQPQHRVSSDRNKERIIQNSPSREPLRQIPTPNQMERSGENQNPVPEKLHQVNPFVMQKLSSQRGVRHQHEVSPNRDKGAHWPTKGRNRNQKGEVTRVDQQKQIRENERKTSANQGYGISKTRGPLNVSREQETFPKQQKEVDQRQTKTSVYQQPNPDSGYKHPLETVYEGETPEATLVNDGNETGSEFAEEGTFPLGPHARIADNQTGSAPENPMESSAISKTSKHSSGIVPHETRVRGDVILSKESYEVADQGAVNQEKNKTEEHRMVGDKDSAALKYSNSSNEHDARTFQCSQQNEDQSKSLDSLEMNRPDPYELLIRQEAQLKELQEQIKMLLRQQNTPAHTLNTMLTPPKTPKSDHLLDNHQSPKCAPAVSMATACTNTGASLLLLSPVKPKGKKSTATSPMKDTITPSSRDQCQRSGSESSLHVTSPVQSNDKNSRDSQSQSVTVNSDEFTNRMLEPDDPSQTLASSLHAVDLPSFHGSPSGVTSPSILGQPERRGMETSFTSPVLGESASILVQERQTNPESKEDITAGGEEDNEQRKSNHVSLLQRNERQFYDNLLDQVKNLLLTQEDNEKDASAESSQDSLPEKPSTTHESTREEVTATMKHLERMKASAFGVSKEIAKTPVSVSSKQWLPHRRSSSLSVIPHHPHINYVSLSVDETLDEVFNEADAIALKYLTDDQLQEHWQITGHHKSQFRTRAVTFSALPDAEKSSLAGRMLFEMEHLCNSNSSKGPDYTWNNLSMATKEYLERYCLAPQQHRTHTQKDAIIGSVPKNVSELSGGDRMPSTSELSYGCKAPPSTPEPNTNANDSQILDINRLKKLPKLF